MSRMARYVHYLLIAVGIVIIIRPAVHYCRWKVREIHAEQVWKEFVNSEQPKYQEIPAAWMEIPCIDLRTIVLDGVSKENLLLYPCLERSGSTFKQMGVKVVLGHRDMHFRRLGKLVPGSRIRITLKDGGTYQYTVKEAEILEPDCVINRVREKRGDWLVLITCYPFSFTGPAPSRYIIWAKKTK